MPAISQIQSTRDVIDEAERQALGPPLRQGRSEGNIATRPSDSLATTDSTAL